MFFIQGQLSEDKCGCFTKMPAYFYLKFCLLPPGLIKVNLQTSPNHIKQERLW